jgi:hypothetical protein
VCVCILYCQMNIFHAPLSAEETSWRQKETVWGAISRVRWVLGEYALSMYIYIYIYTHTQCIKKLSSAKCTFLQARVASKLQEQSHGYSQAENLRISQSETNYMPRQPPRLPKSQNLCDVPWPTFARCLLRLKWCETRVVCRIPMVTVALW